jgi:prepilin-type N-terminal cleavage/methylation domain-containing protein
MSRQQGFSMVEVLVCMALSSIVVVWLSGALRNASTALSDHFHSVVERDDRERMGAQFVMDLRYIRAAFRQPQFTADEMLFVTSTRKGLREVRYFKDGAGGVSRGTRDLGGVDWQISVFVPRAGVPVFVYGLSEGQVLPRWVSISESSIYAELPSQWGNLVGAAP